MMRWRIIILITIALVSSAISGYNIIQNLPLVGIFRGIRFLDTNIQHFRACRKIILNVGPMIVFVPVIHPDGMFLVLVL